MPSFIRAILPVLAILGIHALNVSAFENQRRRPEENRKILGSRGTRTADYNANGPLPKAWDAGSNKTMEPAQAEAAPKSRRAVDFASSRLNPQSDVADESQNFPASRNLPRRAPAMDGGASMASREPFSRRGEGDHDRLSHESASQN